MKRRLFEVVGVSSSLLLLATVIMIYRSFHGETWTRDGDLRIIVQLNRGRLVVEVVSRTNTQPSAAALPVFPAVPPGQTPSMNEKSAHFAAPAIWSHRHDAQSIWPITQVSTFGRTAITQWSIQTVNGGQRYQIDRIRIWACPAWPAGILFAVLTVVWIYSKLRDRRGRYVRGFPVGQSP
jgi:hypothetical protein